jgi:hypothetical protein
MGQSIFIRFVKRGRRTIFPVRTISILCALSARFAIASDAQENVMRAEARFQILVRWRGRRGLGRMVAELRQRP